MIDRRLTPDDKLMKYLDFIKRFMHRHGYAPNYSQIAAEFNENHTSARYVIGVMEKRGMVSVLRHNGRTRAITPLEKESDNGN